MGDGWEGSGKVYEQSVDFGRLALQSKLDGGVEDKYLGIAASSFTEATLSFR
jgi:hypothetical protein